MLKMKEKTLCIFLLTYFFFSHPANAGNSAPWRGETLNGVLCAGKAQGYGPYDYTKRDDFRNNLHLVESAHFHPSTEMLRSTKRSSAMYGDLDYTLRAFPNHHRALNTLIRFLSTNVDYRRTKLSPPECYFLRALNFAPNDSTTHMLYGIYLYKVQAYDLALKSYKTAEKSTPSNAQLQYNLGLVYIALEDYAEAKNYAVKAYAQNFPFQGLKNKLKKLDVW
jgi:tetratricopeptide (TPR) repeat protein